MTTVPVTVYDNEIPQFMIAAGRMVAEIMGDLSYVFAFPYQANRARYKRSDRPVIALNLVRFDANPNAHPVNTQGELIWNMLIQQRLIDQRAAQTNNETYIRIIDTAKGLATRFQRSVRVSPANYKPSKLASIVFDPKALQDSIGAEGVTCHFRTPMELVPQTSLDSPDAFRRSISVLGDADYIFRDPITFEDQGNGIFEFRIALEEIMEERTVVPPVPLPGFTGFADDQDVQNVLNRG